MWCLLHEKKISCRCWVYYLELCPILIYCWTGLWLGTWHQSFLFSVSLFNWLIGQVGRVFANGPGDLGSIPGYVILKTLKMVLMPPCLTLSNIRYISRVKQSNPGKGVAPSPTPWCISYWKGNLLVALNYGRQLYFITYIYIYIYIYICICNQPIGIMVRVFTNGPGDLDSIPGRVIPKTLKMVLMPPCLTLSNIRYISRVKQSNPGKGVAPSPTPWCSSYWKGSLLVALD